MRRKGSGSLLLLVSGLVVGVDLVLKEMALESGVAILNSGLAFGWFEGMWGRYVSLVVFVVVFVVCLRRVRVSGSGLWGWAFFLGGALSNFVDRVIHGVVVDYLTLSPIGAFNLADLAIGFGICIIWVGEYGKDRCDLRGREFTGG